MDEAARYSTQRERWAREDQAYESWCRRNGLDPSDNHWQEFEERDEGEGDD